MVNIFSKSRYQADRLFPIMLSLGPMEPIDKTQRISRNEAARRLNVSPTQVYKFEQLGKLRFVKEEGRTYYDMVEVEELAITYKKPPTGRRKNPKGTTGNGSRYFDAVRGKISAKVFSLFKQGKSCQDVVIEASVTPEFADELWLQYSETPRQRALREQEQAYEKEYKTELRRREHRDFLTKLAKVKNRAAPLTEEERKELEEWKAMKAEKMMQEKKV